jgi:hypothetical protein
MSKNESHTHNENYVEPAKFNTFKQHQNGLGREIKIAFIGNSITLHGPAPDIEWHNNNGMAASRTENDYAHLLLRLLNENEHNSFIGNFAELERNENINEEITEKITHIFDNAPGIVVIQLGDNVGNNEQFGYFINNLNSITKKAKLKSPKVVLLSTWWEHNVKDQAIKQISDLNNAIYVYIGDIFSAKENEDRKIKQYDHGGVDNHPRDWAMNEIARRIFNKIK